MHQTEREKMLANQPYISISDPELIEMMAAAQELLHTFNFSHPNEIETPPPDRA
jgi:maltose O-acetyltransferase